MPFLILLRTRGERQIPDEPDGDGAWWSRPYFQHLKEKAESLGVEVPHFMSGLNHGNSPTSRNGDMSQRTTPWFTTEFWAGWFVRRVEDTCWTIMARGGGRYNDYMVHGGTNFDAWNDPSGGASYDYGAAIGQAGDLRPMFYRMKRANQFALSFPELLAGDDATADFKTFAEGAGVVGARQSPAGTMVILRNPKGEEHTLTLPGGGTLKMNPYEMFPLLQQVALAPGVVLENAGVRVLGTATHGDTTTVVLYGLPGDKGVLTLRADAALTKVNSAAGLAAEIQAEKSANVRVTFPAVGPEECVLQAGPRTLRLVAVSDEAAWYTWFVGAKGQQHVVCGPQFVGDFSVQAGKVSLTAERRFGTPAPQHVVVYGGRGDVQHLAAPGRPELDQQPAPALSAWQQSAAPEIAPDFNDAAWLTSDDPVQMGADGNRAPFAWYRATFASPSAGPGTLTLQAHDHLVAFLNGKPAASTLNNSKATITGELAAGRNTVALLVSHAGRDKGFNFLGSLEHMADKGIHSAVTAEVGGQTFPVKGWKMHGGAGNNAPAGGTWAALGDTAGVPALYRSTFKAPRPGTSGATMILRASYSGLSRGTIWLNGRNLGRYPEKIRLNTLYLPECWLAADSTNTLTIFDEAGNTPEKVSLVIETAASREVMALSTPCDAAVPVVVPQEKARQAEEWARANRGNIALSNAHLAGHVSPRLGCAAIGP